MYIMLGDIDLSGNVTSEIKFNGGFWKVDQKNAISLATSGSRDKASGMSVEFQATFATEAEASAFMAYIVQYSPENPNFDEEEGAGISLYIRSAQWYYTVWSVTATKVREGKASLDYLQYCYEVVCHLRSPFVAGTAQEFDEEDYLSRVTTSLVEICTNKDGDIYVLGSDGILWTFSIADGFAMLDPQCDAKLVKISANNNYVMGIDESGYMHRFDGASWEAFMASDIAYDISIADNGTVYRIGPYEGTSYDPDYDSVFRLSGGAWSRLGYPYSACAAKNVNVVWAIHKTTHATYQYEYSTKSLISSTSMSKISMYYNGAADGITSAGNAVHWNTMYGWQSRSKDVIAIASSGFYVALAIAADGSGIWEYADVWINLSDDITSGEMTFSLDNLDGHFPESPDISIDCEGGSDLTIAIADGESLTIADRINSEENWNFAGSEKQIVETYEDDITSITKWNLDWISVLPQYWGGAILLDANRSSYIRLSGPNKIIKPIKMTADLSLDSGGAIGKAYVQISSDGSNWKTVFDEVRFESGEAVYGIPEAMGMKDCFIRLFCNSGTATCYLNIMKIKFEVTRAAKPLPEVPAGTAKTVTISITDGTMTIDGEFVPKRAMQ